VIQVEKIDPLPVLEESDGPENPTDTEVISTNWLHGEFLLKLRGSTSNHRGKTL